MIAILSGVIQPTRCKESGVLTQKVRSPGRQLFFSPHLVLSARLGHGLSTVYYGVVLTLLTCFCQQNSLLESAEITYSVCLIYLICLVYLVWLNCGLRGLLRLLLY